MSEHFCYLLPWGTTFDVDVSKLPVTARRLALAIKAEANARGLSSVVYCVQLRFDESVRGTHCKIEYRLPPTGRHERSMSTLECHVDTAEDPYFAAIRVLDAMESRRKSQLDAAPQSR